MRMGLKSALLGYSQSTAMACCVLRFSLCGLTTQGFAVPRHCRLSSNLVLQHTALTPLCPITPIPQQCV